MKAHEQATLRRLAGSVTLAERLDPELPQHTLPHRMDARTGLLCAVAAQARAESRLLARVAPWVIISEPVR